MTLRARNFLLLRFNGQRRTFTMSHCSLLMAMAAIVHGSLSPAESRISCLHDLMVSTLCLWNTLCISPVSPHTRTIIAAKHPVSGSSIARRSSAGAKSAARPGGSGSYTTGSQERGVGHIGSDPDSLDGSAQGTKMVVVIGGLARLLDLDKLLILELGESLGRDVAGIDPQGDAECVQAAGFALVHDLGDQFWVEVAASFDEVDGKGENPEWESDQHCGGDQDGWVGWT